MKLGFHYYRIKFLVIKYGVSEGSSSNDPITLLTN